MQPPRYGPSPSASRCGSSNHTQYTVALPKALCSCQVKSSSQRPLSFVTSGGGAEIVPVAPFAQKKSGEIKTRSPTENEAITLPLSLIPHPNSASRLDCSLARLLLSQ